MNRIPRRRKMARAGAVAVEFAVVAPVLVMVAVWMCEGARLYEVHATLSTAAREGARLAAMDRRDLIGEGQTTNDKIINDVRSYLNCSGLPGEIVDIAITEADDPFTTFDLDDPANDLELFQLRVDLPYSEIRPLIIWGGEDLVLSSHLTFRNARAEVVQ